MIDLRGCSRIINTAECYAIHETDYRERGDLMGVALRNKLDIGREVSAVDYLRAQRWRRTLVAQIDRLFDVADIIICGGATRVAPDYADRAGIKAFTGESAMAVFSMSGHPAMSVCSGFSQDGLPLNVQLGGRRFEDGRVAVAGDLLEKAFALKGKRPPDPGAPVPPPAWTKEPVAAVSAGERRRRAVTAMNAAVKQLPHDLPTSLEPYVNMRSSDATQ
jgi:aspartyl-tRNA(Asn)/glutamyl-tRNA(Gln) amidotransferase subunit A